MFDFEKWLLTHSSWEDMDSVIMFSPLDGKGGFSLLDYEGYHSSSGRTLEEACHNWCEEHRRQYKICRCDEEKQNG